MSELLDAAVAIVERAAAGEQMEVFISRSHGTEIRAYEGAVEQLRSASSAGVGIRIVLSARPTREQLADDATRLDDAPERVREGTVEDERPEGAVRVGFAWAGSLESSVVDDVLREARDNALYATPDPYSGLAIPDGVAAVELDLFRESTTTTPTVRKLQMALELEGLVRHADARVRQVRHADYGDSSVEVAIASTTGVRAASRRTSAHVSVSAIAGDGDESRTATGISVGRSPGDLDPGHAGAEAVARAVRLLGAERARSGRRPVVFDPRVASTILGVLASALSGEAVGKGRSIFSGRLGEQVGAVELTLVDDPTDARAFRAAIHDAEGLACRRNVLVEAGILRGFLHDTVSARRAGTRSTASAVRNGFAGTPRPGGRAVALVPGRLDQPSILREVGEGLYVQSVTGVHSGVNPVSGDFSVGADGLVIRTGELAEPVCEVTVASTLQRILRSLLYVGSDVEWLPGVSAGQTLAVADMQVSGS